ncbi:TspO protein [Candidatus Falkowbacteria bacterium RIFOXYD2_FULL_35_9]|uniref:TspO protein n=1 Tax=Candidatus Falkowbacteria bacterium RIFOXYC2_FULL_36_12 TaxID=1798002 RepID=A0A1F5T0P8_9BACT|nr:MAG: TspO protein [Candidatus Falkowbacteria bacterium RIFOXYB2_FULL_35_7]OGF32323.1 MAG: TspO protein [Candidatus Falkowbacteria bacterium RIFOXYC2_FULL_36_12]OGF34540.1 MAG: TspO protein [Candidatus Falkowbacteria bacterium RIFOXYA2_FULL_35_8]OGF48419.1 MAG: TspO protein [Candidatus Falkowbacteria bacterium RIFOXYD2_FULL_35_9]
MMWKKFIISISVPLLAGFIGSFFTFGSIDSWYSGLNKPVFSPPNWLFGPVWTILYVLMGISVYLIWRKLEKNEKVRSAFIFFWVHLFFNAIWSIIFFGLQSPVLALVDIVIIWLMILMMIIWYWKIEKWSSILLWPYIIWVSFASVLNLSIVMLN